MRGTSFVVRRSSMPGYAHSSVSPCRSIAAPARALQAFRPDLVHVVTEGPLGAAGRRLRRFAPGFRSSPRFTPIFPATPPDTSVAGPWRRCARTCGAFTALPRSRRRPAKRRGASWLSWDCPRIVVWGRGVDSALFSPQRRSGARREAMGAAHRRGRAAREPAGGGKGRGHTRSRVSSELQDRLGDALCFVVAGDGPRAADVRDALPYRDPPGIPGPTRTRRPLRRCGPVRLSVTHRDLRTRGARGDGVGTPGDRGERGWRS